MTITAAHLSALRLIWSRLHDKGINWALTGSMSFALQGLPVTVHDIDIQTDRDGAYRAEQHLREFVHRPVAFSGTERIQSHLGALQIGGIHVEIMGNIQKRLPDGTWEEPVDPSRYRETVVVQGMEIPVLSLAYERQAYLAMGRTEKVRLLDEWLQHSCKE